MQHKRPTTTAPISEKNITREYVLIDAKGQVLGRMANKVATLLQGKHKPSYVPHLDSGDHVVVINARQVSLTGHKMQEKTYQRYSGYPGGQREIPLATMMEQNPVEVVRHAVSGMLPKNKLRDRRLTRLHIYAGSEHPFTNIT